MAYLRIIRPQLVTADIYDAVTAELDIATNHPLGMISHAAGEVEGSWQIVEIWESEEYARRFDAERLVPAIELVTGSPPPGDAPTMSFELHQLVTP
jgi:hypothetical protein